MDGLDGVVSQDFLIWTLYLLISASDSLLVRAMKCFVFMLLQKYEIFAVLVRNVGVKCTQLKGGNDVEQTLEFFKKG